MKRFIEFSLEQGGTILVEVEAPEEEGLTKVGRLDEMIERAEQSFESALERIKPPVNTLIDKLSELSVFPDEISVEFGIKLNKEVGALIASASLEAHFNITLKWEPKKKAG